MEVVENGCNGDGTVLVFSPVCALTYVVAEEEPADEGGKCASSITGVSPKDARRV